MWSSRRVLGWRADIVGDRSHTSQVNKRGTRPRVFKSRFIGKTKIAISGATDAQIGPSRRQNVCIDEYYIIVKQYDPFDGCRGTESPKRAAILHAVLCDDRCSKRDKLSS